LAGLDQTCPECVARFKADFVDDERQATEDVGNSVEFLDATERLIGSNVKLEHHGISSCCEIAPLTRFARCLMVANVGPKWVQVRRSTKTTK